MLTLEEVKSKCSCWSENSLQLTPKIALRPHNHYRDCLIVTEAVEKAVTRCDCWPEVALRNAPMQAVNPANHEFACPAIAVLSDEPQPLGEETIIGAQLNPNNITCRRLSRHFNDAIERNEHVYLDVGETVYDDGNGVRSLAWFRIKVGEKGKWSERLYEEP